MATVPYSTDTDRGEARFFFTMACVMAVTIVAGFLFNILAGRSSFGMPLVVHVHAWIMMSWIGLYLAQNYFVASDNIGLHRKLGWLSALWVPAMVAMGFVITSYSLRSGGAPPFFGENEFLFGNPMELVTVGVLIGWAVAVRKNTGWHRRLMYCSFALLTGPGISRFVPVILFEPYSWWFAIGITTIFPIIGMMADKRRYGRVHPAWLCGIGLLVAVEVSAMLVAYSSFGVEFTKQFVAGTPGAVRSMAAFIPPV